MQILDQRVKGLESHDTEGPAVVKCLYRRAGKRPSWSVGSLWILCLA